LNCILDANSYQIHLKTKPLTWNFPSYLQIDLSPPQARLTLSPAVLTGSDSARFQFSASIGGAIERCAGCLFRCTFDEKVTETCRQGSGPTDGVAYT
jgi:hypothetical protein